MNLLRRIGNWIVAGVVIICVTVVFNALGKGVLDLSDDGSFVFALAATVVAAFLYRRHAPGAEVGPAQRFDAISKVLIVVTFVVLLTIPSKIRAIEVEVDTSSLEEQILDLQGSIEEVRDKIDSIETNMILR